MAQATAIRLTGEDLRIDDVWAVAFGAADAALSDEARAKMRAARELVERAAHGTSEHTYGINTGFGRFVSKSIPEEQTEELQLRLLRSHACGVGEPYPDEIVRAAMVLRANAVAKEGLSLVNGTQFMAAFGALGVARARRLAKTADLACALSLEALQGSRTSFIPQIHRLRPLHGQRDSAANVFRLLEGSAINEAHRWCDKVQDAYSLRCAPQVHGASRDLLDYVEGTVAVELNSATDNPLVLVEDELLVSNGNFHGQPLAFALDALAMAVAEFASISERRVERLVNPSLSDGLPAFLTHDGGLNSGFMIPQYVAAALVSENKVPCHPASVDSIPTSAGQEDHVSMGNAAGLKAWQVLANSERAVAIELLAGAQAVEFHAPLEPGAGGRARRAAVRELSPRLRDDRQLSPDIEAVAAAIRDGSLIAAAAAGGGELR